MYLFDGRRVRLADLIDADLLAVGETLVFERPRLRQRFTAEITRQGRIRLADGREFRSPSRAGVEAAQVNSLDGWTAWMVERSGERLDELRLTLLDRDSLASSPATDAPTEQPAATGRHARLQRARSAAFAGSPEELAVRDLISMWGAKSRGHRVKSRIAADLANHGLTTTPDFRKVGLDSDVTLVLQLSTDDPETDGEVEQESPAAAALVNEEDPLDVGLTLGNIPAALGGITAVSPNNTLPQAVSKMLLDDYSQLAVLSGERSLKGAVTWRSIAEAVLSDPTAQMSEAVVTAHSRSFDTELVDVLDLLFESDFVFVQDETNRIAGIVTTADVAQLYGEMTTPFFLVGEIDYLLRSVVDALFSVEEIIEACDPNEERQITSVDDLTFGDYKATLESHSGWSRLEWHLDRKIFINRLDEVRELRNAIAHFNPDPLPADAVATLRHFLEVIRSLWLHVA